MRTLADTVSTGGATRAPSKGRFDRGEPQYAPEVRSDYLPPMEYRDMPEPLPLRKVLGPSVILAGVGVVLSDPGQRAHVRRVRPLA